MVPGFRWPPFGWVAACAASIEIEQFALCGIRQFGIEGGEDASVEIGMRSDLTDDVLADQEGAALVASLQFGLRGTVEELDLRVDLCGTRRFRGLVAFAFASSALEGSFETVSFRHGRFSVCWRSPGMHCAPCLPWAQSSTCGQELQGALCFPGVQSGSTAAIARLYKRLESSKRPTE
jgi:hypothetical protein